MLAQGGLTSKFEVSLKRFPNDPKNKLFLTCNALIQHPQIKSFIPFPIHSHSSYLPLYHQVDLLPYLGQLRIENFEMQILSYFIDLKKKCDYPILVSALNWHKRLIDLVRNWNGTDLYFQITSGCEE
jgi:hypothetical protein